MKARLSLVITIAATMLWSCQFDDVLSTPSNDGVIRVTSTLTKTESASGPSTGSTTNDNFKNDEIIYVWARKTDGGSTDDYIKAWQLKAKDANGNFSGDSKAWPYDGSNLNFYALHGNFTEPALDNKWSDLTSLKHTVLDNQISDEKRRQSDLLFAEKTGATHGSNVELSFSHLLAKITVKLDLKNSMGIKPEEFDGATVSILGIKPEAIFDSSTAMTSTSEVTPIEINAGTIDKPLDFSSEAYYAGCAIVPLQTINAEQPLIKISLKDRTFIYKAYEETEFQKGQEYTYTLTILGKQITGSLSVSPFSSEADKSIPFEDYFDYLADLKNRNYLGSSSAPHDLSYDYNGQMNTANCYVVTHPGYYKLPLVYGNAIKNGATNAIAYGSSTFVNHLGNPITEPYIYDNSDCTVRSAELVWQDAQNLISNIGLSSDNHYIQFKITKENIEQGNAVIAVKDENGKIMWSWHIWVTNKNVYETVPVKNATGYTNNFMPIPLGWDDDIVELPNCTFYQWGRKDPFVGSTGSGKTTKTWYDGSGNTKANTNPDITTTRTKKESIQHPEKYISGNSTWDSSTTFDNWNANVTSIPTSHNEAFNDNVVVKTVYDPSPVGFKMPTTNAFTGFGSGSTVNFEGSWDSGYKFTTGLSSPNPISIYFRANGYRSYSGGSLDNVTTCGYYWASGPYSNTTNGCSLDFFQGYVYPQTNYNRACGFSVRPVSE